MKFSGSLTWPRYLRCFPTWLTSILPSSVTNNSLQWPLQLHTFPTKCKWLGLMTQLPITFHFYKSPITEEDVKSAKEIECNQYKRTAAVFSPSLSAPCPVCFYLVIPKHDLGPCYACFGHVMGIRGLWHVTGHVPFGTLITWEIMSPKRARVSPNCF
jgi:hypothetical protein